MSGGPSVGASASVLPMNIQGGIQDPTVGGRTFSPGKCLWGTQ